MKISDKFFIAIMAVAVLTFIVVALATLPDNTDKQDSPEYTPPPVSPRTESATINPRSMPGPIQASPGVIDVKNPGGISGKAMKPDNSPVEGVRIVARNNDGEQKEARTGADGTYAMSGLKPGPYHLEALSDGFAVGQWPRVEVAGGSTTTGIDFILQSGGRLIVYVKDMDGRPLSLATVVIEPDIEVDANDSRPMKTGKVVRLQTDDDGSASANTLAAGRYKVEARHHEHLPPMEPIFVSIQEGATASCEIYMTKGGSVYGKVLDFSGNPLSRARVTLHWKEDTPGRPGLTSAGSMTNPRTKSDGSFGFTGLKDGDYNITVILEGFRPLEVTGISVRGAGEVSGLVLTMERGQIITGNVLDEWDSPIEGARVYAYWGKYNASSTSDANGYFEIGGLEDGKVRIQVYRQGYTSVAMSEVEVGDTGLSITMKKSGEGEPPKVTRDRSLRGAENDD